MKLIKYLDEHVSEVLWMPIAIAIAALPFGIAICLVASWIVGFRIEPNHPVFFG